ncbi:MAG: GtrA family protein [Propionibacteriaceae bacterium]|nr:GtrA family protein [Propionibacteriaceae bacterium]
MLRLVLRFDLKGLLLTPTTNVVVQVFRALFVAALAFIADAGLLWVLSLTGMHYLICAAFGFILGVIVNFVLSIKFVFKEKAPVGRRVEFLVYLLVGLGGFGITIGLMWFFTEIVGFHFMVSKLATIVATFIWNFGVRKLTLYRKDSSE